MTLHPVEPTPPNIAQALRDQAVPTSDVIPHPENPRRGDVSKIKASLERFGQVRPVVIQASTGRIVAGNHTFKAVCELGWPTIAATYVDLSDEEALAYVLADNSSSDAATWDDAGLLTALEKLAESSSLDGTGFTPDDLDDLHAAIGNVNTDPEDFTGDYAESPDATADRWADRDEGMRREVVFLLEKEKYEDFLEAVRVLKVHFGTDSMAETIYQAVTHMRDRT